MLQLTTFMIHMRWSFDMAIKTWKAWAMDWFPKARCVRYLPKLAHGSTPGPRATQDHVTTTRAHVRNPSASLTPASFITNRWSSSKGYACDIPAAPHQQITQLISRAALWSPAPTRKLRVHHRTPHPEGIRPFPHLRRVSQNTELTQHARTWKSSSEQI